jgi:hypothetical protein
MNTKIVIAVLIGVLIGMGAMVVLGLLQPYRPVPVTDPAADHVRLMHVWLSHDKETMSLWKQKMCGEKS